MKSIVERRLHAHHISGGHFSRPEEIVRWMGAVQAQDFAMSRWAVGIRSQSLTEKDFDSAYNSGKIIRTHLLRPTWHLAAADDLRWMLNLTAPRILRILRNPNEKLGLTGKVISFCRGLFEKMLAGNAHATREELIALLREHGVNTQQNRPSHIFMRLELEGVLCSGRLRDGKPTYALLDERVPDRNVLSRDEALGELVKRYFKSHGPATVKDFLWWSGLTSADAKRGIQFAGKELYAEAVQETVFYSSAAGLPWAIATEQVHLLPAYDEFIISYKDRAAILAVEHQNGVISKNGVFWPVFLYKGKVAGKWTRRISGAKAELSAVAFGSVSASLKRAAKTASEKWGRFAGKNVTLNCSRE